MRADLASEFGQKGAWGETKGFRQASEACARCSALAAGNIQPVRTAACTMAVRGWEGATRSYPDTDGT